MRYPSSRVKICQIVVTVLKRLVNSSSNFASLFILMIYNFFANFNLIHFLLWIKGSYQSPNLKTFECSGENLPNSWCYFSNYKLVFLQILHHSSVLWNINPLYLFSSSIIHFVQKEPIKVQIFETFECSGQNLWNSPCQFWNHESIPLQILHHSSLSWHISPL